MATIGRKATKADLIQLVQQLEKRVLDLEEKNKEHRRDLQRLTPLDSFWRRMVNAVALPDPIAIKSCRDAVEEELYRLDKQRGNNGA